jgi:hypothetical protein
LFFCSGLLLAFSLPFAVVDEVLLRQEVASHFFAQSVFGLAALAAFFAPLITVFTVGDQT